MNQHALAIERRVEIFQGSSISRAPANCTPAARLRMVLTWPKTRQQKTDAGAKTQRWSALSVLIAVAFLTLAFTGVDFGTSYLYGLAAQQLRQFQRYCNPQGAYYDASQYAGSS